MDATTIDDKPRRFLARLRLSARKCYNCKHFNLAVGQQALAEHPAFQAAASVLSPDRMSRNAMQAAAVRVVEATVAAGQPILPSEEAPAPATAPGPVPPMPPAFTGAKWSEMGACTQHEEIRWCRDACDRWG